VDIALIANFVLMWISCIKFIKGELPTWSDIYDYKNNV
jgi:hypothetical protein